MRSKEITNSEDIIDSRDVIARIEELESDAEADRLAEGEAGELAALKALAAEAEGYSADWSHGEVLIRDSYFKEHAQQLADDIGAVNAAQTWPNNCIDWDKAARELQQDYTPVEFGDVTYWIRD
jgi:hypothetical protein